MSESSSVLSRKQENNLSSIHSIWKNDVHLEHHCEKKIGGGKNWWLWWKQLLFVYNYRNNFHAVNTKMFFVHSFNTFKNIINIFMIDFHLR